MGRGSGTGSGRAAAAPTSVAGAGDASAGPARVCVAQIGAPHGVHGEVRLKSFTAEPLAVATYGPLATEDGRSLRLEALRPAKDMLIARIAGIADRNGAAALRNLRLYVPRARLPAIDEAETFYHADLIGLAAVGRDGAPLGTVVAVPNFGAGDLVEIAPATGGPSLLVPFTKAAVPDIDLAGKRIVVDPPADLGE